MTRSPLHSLWITLLVLLLPFGAGAAQDVPDPVQQVLSISASPRYDPPPNIADIFAGLALAADAGVTGDFHSERWSALEPSLGAYVLTDVENYLKLINGAYDYTLLLGVQALNTTAKETPSDLLDVPFDDPRMIAAFTALFDALRPSLTENVRYFSIGNEVDVYLSAHPEEWPAYKVFFDTAAAYIHESAPWIQVGVTFTFSGALANPEEFAQLNEASDVVILTYYPFEDAFAFDDPAAPLRDFPRMIELAGGRPLILQEAGYPSAELTGSTPQMQADFVRHVFEAWAAADDAIPFLNFFLLHDFSEQMCSDFELYYNLPDERFHAFLCSLGFREADGTPKPSWETFIQEAQQWGTP
jgi:hypothetical protein